MNGNGCYQPVTRQQSRWKPNPFSCDWIAIWLNLIELQEVDNPFIEPAQKDTVVDMKGPRLPIHMKLLTGVLITHRASKPILPARTPLLPSHFISYHYFTFILFYYRLSLQRSLSPHPPPTSPLTHRSLASDRYNLHYIHYIADFFRYIIFILIIDFGNFGHPVLMYLLFLLPWVIRSVLWCCVISLKWGLRHVTTYLSPSTELFC